MDYDEKVRLALVLGLDPELKRPLNAAGALRNTGRCEKLGEATLEELFTLLNPFGMSAVTPIADKFCSAAK